MTLFAKLAAALSPARVARPVTVDGETFRPPSAVTEQHERLTRGLR